MTDPEIHHWLSSLPVPSPGGATQQEAWQRARAAFVNRPTATTTDKVFTRLLRECCLPVAASAVCALVVFSFHFRKPGVDDSINLHVLVEMEKLFPGQLSALIVRGDQITLELSDDDAGSRSQPVVLTLRHAQETIRVLTYSGSSFCVRLGARQLCFETLVTAGGGTILAGEQFVRMPGDLRPVGGYQVRAQTLPTL